jgi:hypothetical protein
MSLQWSKLHEDGIVSDKGHVILRTWGAFFVFDGRTTKKRTARCIASFITSDEAKEYCETTPVQTNLESVA